MRARFCLSPRRMMRAERSALMLLFSRHVSHRVADQLWERREEFLDGGRPRPQRLTATVMFVDIRGFTSTAEKLDPERLMEWLNAFMGAMADEAERHGGFVDDYFGDGLKVNFGVPVPRRSEEEICADCEAAVRCALSMGRRLARVNASWREQGLPTGAMRVGIATGTAVAGSLGSADRLKYTVVGDTVNTAARLESFDDSKHDYSQRLCRILVAEETRILVEDRFSIRDFGRVSLKGKAEPVQVFEVLGEPGEAREEVRT